MTTRTPAPSVAARRAAFALEVSDAPDVVLRVLSVLQRRRCVVRAVDYRAADRHGPGRFEVAVEAPPAHAHRVPAWLEGLVDVVAVSRADR